MKSLPPRTLPAVRVRPRARKSRPAPVELPVCRPTAGPPPSLGVLRRPLGRRRNGLPQTQSALRRTGSPRPGWLHPLHPRSGNGSISGVVASRGRRSRSSPSPSLPPPSLPPPSLPPPRPPAALPSSLVVRPPVAWLPASAAIPSAPRPSTEAALSPPRSWREARDAPWRRQRGRRVQPSFEVERVTAGLLVSGRGDAAR